MILFKMQPASCSPPYHIAPWNVSTIPVEAIQVLAAKSLSDCQKVTPPSQAG